MADEINKKPIVNLYVERYNHANSLVNGILSDIGILDLFPKNIDAAGLYLNKIFGFNCALEAHLKRIESGDSLWLYNFKLISYFASFKYIDKSKTLEISSCSFKKKCNLYPYKIDVLFVASLENYAKALLTHALSLNSKDNNIVFFFPVEAQDWHILPKIKEKFEVIYPSDMGLGLDEYILLSEKYKKIISRNLNNINKNRFLYRNTSYFRIAIKPISYFLTDFVSTNVVFLNAMHLFFKKSPPSELYVARDRRAIENSFVQVLGSLGVKTHMIMHGVITSNYDYSQLFTTHYRYIDYVHIWGDQQLSAIKRKQESLQQRMPIIVKNTAKFNLRKNCKNTSKELLVVVGQKTNDNDLFSLSQKIVKLIKGSRFKVIFRPHPDTYSDFARVKKVHVDHSSDFASSILPKASLVITHSSTALLEGVSVGAGCIVLDYSKFNKGFTSIYKEECNFLVNNKYIISNSDQQTLLLINKYISSEKFVKQNQKFSKQLYSWFVG